jgi:two-component system, OmpR family, sensor histidine kinase TctE
MPRREPAIFTRLIVLISLVLSVGAGALLTAAWYYALAAANQAFDRLLVGAAYQIAESVNVQDGVLTVDLPTSAFELLALSERDRIFYKIVGPQGKVLTGYSDLEVEDEDGSFGRPMARDGSFKGEAIRTIRITRTFSDPAAQGRVEVVVGQTIEARSALARELTLRAIILVGIMSALALSGAAFAIRYALRPIGRLEAALRRREPHDVMPITVSTPRELRPFVSSINEFIDRLKARVDMMQQFIADAAHQIRTPLTALTAQVDLLSHHTTDPQGLQHLARVQDRTNQLSRLANQLLSHALVNHRSGIVPFEVVDVLETVRRAFREAVPDTLDRDVLTSLELPNSPVEIVGDAVSLKEAIKNIIDNAIRHGAPTRLTVRVRDLPDAVEVEIEDDGPGIPAEKWPQVMKRFGSSSPGGSGLGFSIAADVAIAHNGCLELRERNEQAFAVIVRVARSQGVIS